MSPDPTLCITCLSDIARPLDSNGPLPSQECRLFAAHCAWVRKVASKPDIVRTYDITGFEPA